MNHASLFSGIGGFDLAAEWAGWNNIFHCEWNPFGQKVLKHHFPNSISYNDITKTDFTIHKGSIDIITGGFPCQPYSTAGLRKGKADERHLFPEMLRAIKEIRPRWIIGENVRGLVSWSGGLVFHEVCADLESEGYEVQPFIIPAAGVNAPHRRERIWFVAYAASVGLCKHSQGQRLQSKTFGTQFGLDNETITDTNSAGQQAFGIQIPKLGQQIEKKTFCRNSFKPTHSRLQWDAFPIESAICSGNNGIPDELDGITFSKWRKESIKAYGNAIVPQVAFEIFKTINTFEEQLKNL